MGATRQTTEVVPRSIPRRGSNPGTLIILGVIILAFWGFVMTMQIQTNEAFINGTQNVNAILQPQWSIWLQFPKLLFGDAVPGPALKDSDLIGIIVGWGVEIFFLALLAAFEVAIHTSQKFGQFLGAVFRVFTFVICIFDFYSDASYGNVSPTAHAAFAIFCSVVVAFGLTWGLSLVEHGWKKL